MKIILLLIGLLIICTGCADFQHHNLVLAETEIIMEVVTINETDYLKLTSIQKVGEDLGWGIVDGNRTIHFNSGQVIYMN